MLAPGYVGPGWLFRDGLVVGERGQLNYLNELWDGITEPGEVIMAVYPAPPTHASILHHIFYAAGFWGAVVVRLETRQRRHMPQEGPQRAVRRGVAAIICIITPAVS